ncbi:MAG: HD domain-containing protein [Gammaproteobacteria bacterium]|nr:HD domain-containing protein [Gammaproteobacteria bacterium]
MTAYLEHLINLQGKAKVIAVEDILSDSGMLIAKSGTEINQNTYKAVTKFKLLKPLEDSISIVGQLNSNTIFNHIIDLLNDDPYLKELHSELGCEDVLQKCCRGLKKFPVLLQKLTVLHYEVNHIYLQSLLSAYLSCLCAYNQKFPENLIEEAFLGGLVHNIGLLHIDRYILTKQDALTTEEERKTQSHPVIGYKILKRITHFPESAARAVLEHHENFDGSGYPRAKTSHNLGDPGRLISLLDKVVSIYDRKLKPPGRSLRDVIPVVQVSMRSYPPNVYASIIQVLKAAPLSSFNQSDSRRLTNLIKHAQTLRDYIGIVSRELKVVNEKVGYIHNEKRVYGIQDVAINILVVLNSAGLDDSQSLDWQQQPDNQEYQQNLYSEVENSRLMQEEIICQLQTYQNSLVRFINKYPAHQFVDVFAEMLEFFDKTPCPKKLS